jgi:hypothetical protein
VAAKGGGAASGSSGSKPAQSLAQKRLAKTNLTGMKTLGAFFKKAQ